MILFGFQGISPPVTSSIFKFLEKTYCKIRIIRSQEKVQKIELRNDILRIDQGASPIDRFWLHLFHICDTFKEKGGILYGKNSEYQSAD